MFISSQGAVFDIRTELEEELESSWIGSDSSSLEKASGLPDIEHVDHRFKGTSKGYGHRHSEMSSRRFGRPKRDSYFDSRGSEYPRISRPSYVDDEDSFFQRPKGGFRSNHDSDNFGLSRRSSFKDNRRYSARNRSEDSDDENFFRSKKSSW